MFCKGQLKFVKIMGQRLVQYQKMWDMLMRKTCTCTTFTHSSQTTEDTCVTKSSVNVIFWDRTSLNKLCHLYKIRSVFTLICIPVHWPANASPAWTPREISSLFPPPPRTKTMRELQGMKRLHYNMGRPLIRDILLRIFDMFHCLLSWY